MSLPPDLTPKQDMPPPGGFKVIDFGRKIRAPRLSGVGLLGIMGGLFLLGQYEGSRIRQEKRDQESVKRERRSFIAPFVQAESDARKIISEQKALEREMYLMRDVPGWVPGESVYVSKKYVPYHPKTPEIFRLP